MNDELYSALSKIIWRNSSAYIFGVSVLSHFICTYWTEPEPVPPVGDVLGSLPTLNGRQLREEEEELARMQIKALTMFIG